jgi:hypothetical protein
MKLRQYRLRATHRDALKSFQPRLPALQSLVSPAPKIEEAKRQRRKILIGPAGSKAMVTRERSGK